ncbi:Ig-like domain repeat protein [Singulisphaera sp. PoT]|uniref:Ig-like domain repeat protein n=1 Tax=Singulisphaera sp. PoT TaxID=3411797 RepID=UPI003BF61718
MSSLPRNRFARISAGLRLRPEHTRTARGRSRDIRLAVESVESRTLLAAQPLVMAALGDSLTDEYQFYGPPSPALLGTLTSTPGNGNPGAPDEITSLLSILGSLQSAPGGLGSAALTLPPEIFLTGRSSERNWLENLSLNFTQPPDFGPYSPSSRGATREQGYEQDWALSGTTAAGFNYGSTGTTFEQEYNGYQNEFPTTGNQLQPGLITQSQPASTYTIQDVNVVTILIGGNDYARAAQNYVVHNDTAPLETQGSSGQWVINEAIENSLASAIAAIQAASPNTKIVLMTTPDITFSPLVDSLLTAVSPFYPNLRGDISRDAQDLNTFLKSTYGNMSNVGVIDTQQLFTNFASNPVISGVTVNMAGAGQAYTDAFSGDGFHPGTILQGLIAQAVINEVNTLFPGSTPLAPLTDAQIVSFAINSQPNVTLASSAPASTVGQSVTLTARVSPALLGASVPTGMVTFQTIVTDSPNPLVSPFKVPGVILGTAPLNAQGFATLTLPSLPAGNVQIAAFYNGSPIYEAVLSSELTQTTTATPAPTSTTIASSQGVATFGQPVTFTAFVTADGVGLPTPTGTVTFRDATTNQVLGTADLNGQGQAVLTTASLGVGTHAIVADYAGTTTLASSTSAAFSEVVNAAPAPPPPPPIVIPSPVTTTQLVPVYETVRGRRFVVFQVIVSPMQAQSSVPGGIVTITYGTHRITSLVLNNGTASLVVPLGQAVRRFAYANYQGQSPFLASGSATIYIRPRPALRPIIAASTPQPSHAIRAAAARPRFPRGH